LARINDIGPFRHLIFASGAVGHPTCSYTGADQSWAEWIAYVLEEEDYRVAIQAWDFRPGGNFVLEMQRAASAADRTIAVLSPEYLTSGYAAAEWASALAQDPQGIRKKLLPVMVRYCEVPGL
jgi:hypothetical protein